MGPGHSGDALPPPKAARAGVGPVSSTWGGRGGKGIQDPGSRIQEELLGGPLQKFLGGRAWRTRVLCLACLCSRRHALCFPLVCVLWPDPPLTCSLSCPTQPPTGPLLPLRTDPWAGSGHRGPLGSLQPSDSPLAAWYLLPAVWLPGPEHPTTTAPSSPSGVPQRSSSRGQAGWGGGPRAPPTCTGALSPLPLGRSVLPSPSPRSTAPHRTAATRFLLCSDPRLVLLGAGPQQAAGQHTVGIGGMRRRAHQKVLDACSQQLLGLSYALIAREPLQAKVLWAGG